MQKDSDCVTFGYKHEPLLDCCSIAVEINTLPKRIPFIGKHSKYRSWYNGRKPNVVARWILKQNGLVQNCGGLTMERTNLSPKI